MTGLKDLEDEEFRALIIYKKRTRLHHQHIHLGEEGPGLQQHKCTEIYGHAQPPKTFFCRQDAEVPRFSF